MNHQEKFVEPLALRQTMRQWTSGVTVLTTVLDGQIHGMTVSSFTSVSLEPPVVLVSLNQESRTYQLVAQSRVFGVTILAEDQKEISERFAGRVPDEADRFDPLETFQLLTGSPFLKGGLGFIDCEVTHSFEIGANTLFLGSVVATYAASDQKPLVYHRQDYRLLCGL